MGTPASLAAVSARPIAAARRSRGSMLAASVPPKRSMNGCASDKRTQMQRRSWPASLAAGRSLTLTQSPIAGSVANSMIMRQA